MDTLIKQLPDYAVVIVLIYGAVIAIAYFYKAYYEAKKPYLTAVFTYCQDISEIVARIRSSDEFPGAEIQKFWAYYYGRLVIVEDENLAGKMVQYGKILLAITPENFSKEKEKLHNPALAVSGACRELIRATWRLSIVPWAKIEKSRATAAISEGAGAGASKETAMQLAEKVAKGQMK
jgi:hypothetical protein